MGHPLTRLRCVLSRCGPAQHSIELAGRGAHVYALDKHAGMLSYANELAAAAGARITFLKADMEDFRLPVGDPARTGAAKCLCSLHPVADCLMMSLKTPSEAAAHACWG